MTRDKPRMLAIDDTPANLITLGAARASEHDLQSLLRPDEAESCRHTGEGRYLTEGSAEPGVQSAVALRYWIPASAGMTTTFYFIGPEQ